MMERYFQEYLKTYKPYKTYWNYEDGCVLMGCAHMYEATGDPLYAEFVLDYLMQRVTPDGQIPSYLTEAYSLDSFHCSKQLFFAGRLTQDPRFLKAAVWQAKQIMLHPRTKSGLCWHKAIYPEQVWIDGVYMAAPFYAQYALVRNHPEIYREIGRWFAFLEKHLRNPETGLYYHAMDEAGTQPWANPETGLSRTHWLRGAGWLMMALADTIALLPAGEEALRRQLTDMLDDALDAIMAYRAENGMFYQVIDRADAPGNYTEASGSLMLAYALLQSPDPARADDGLSILEAVKREKLSADETGALHLHDICKAAGLGGESRRDGSCAYYLSEPRVSDDPKGTGILMMAEAAAIRQQKAVTLCHTTP